jgi:hypothetical protein
MPIHRLFRNDALVVCIFLLSTPLWPQQMSYVDRGRALDMLQTVSSEVKKHYYDPKFHGVDFDAKIAVAKQQIQTSDSWRYLTSPLCWKHWTIRTLFFGRRNMLIDTIMGFSTRWCGTAAS